MGSTVTPVTPVMRARSPMAWPSQTSWVAPVVSVIRWVTGSGQGVDRRS